jgi:hypothetical protein
VAGGTRRDSDRGTCGRDPLTRQINNSPGLHPARPPRGLATARDLFVKCRRARTAACEWPHRRVMAHGLRIPRCRYLRTGKRTTEPEKPIAGRIDQSLTQVQLLQEN